MYGKQSRYPKYATFDDNQITGAEPDVSGMNDNLITESWIVDFKSYQAKYWNELKRKNEILSSTHKQEQSASSSYSLTLWPLAQIP